VDRPERFPGLFRHGWEEQAVMKPVLFLLAAGLAASAVQAEETWTLYRSELGQPRARVHIATFDAYLEHPKPGSISYNHQNCRLAAEVLRLRWGSALRYWCEYGRFREE
jgi:hypothetical protein